MASLIPLNLNEILFDKFIIYQMSGIIHPTRIRKSLIAIDGTDQRKSFFYALKLLGVLPPKGSDFSSWTFKSVTGIEQYKPKCLHDVLIGSHATSCQHTTIYFAFYHRHFMIIMQIFLNFAHQILKGGFPTLGESYPPSIKFKDTEPFKSIVGFKFNSTTQFDFLYEGSNISYWAAVFSIYKGLKGVPEQISCHYWAPTNFLQKDDLTIPIELAPKIISNDPIDVLFNGINKSYPWEINTQRRWFNTPQQYNKSKLPFQDAKPISYSLNQEKFLNGQLDPRLNPTVFRQTSGLTTSFLTGYLQNNRKMVTYRTYATYNDTKRNFRLNAIEERQSLANYGAKNKNVQYITQAQKNTLISKGYGGSWIQNYNAALPHYQYASALFHNMKDFFEGVGTNGLQRSHNYMHNNFKYILNDAQYSVTSLLFYPYHSWIDAMLQFKLREGNNTSRRPSYDYFYTLLNDKYAKIPFSIQGKLRQQFARVGQQTYPISRWFLSGTNEIPSDVAGRYPILEWYNIHTSKMSFSFCSRDYIITKTDIRTSQKFNQIYHFPQYVQRFASRYSFYKNLSKFNYNYNYQIGSSPNDRNNLLNEFATNIPQYLKDMHKDITGKDYPRLRSLTHAIEVTKKIAKVQSFEDQEQLSLEVRKLFLGNVELFASFLPSTENGSNPVVLKLKNVLKDLSKQLNEHQLQEIENYVYNGVQASDIFIFGKQQRAQECQRCQDLKGEFLNLDDDLRIRIPRIWKYLHISSLNEVYFDSEFPEKEPKCIYDKLDLVPNPKFTAYRLVTGAEQIFIDIKSNILTKEAKFIRLDTESYSVRTNTMKIVASKKHQTFHTNFDFYKLFDVDNESERSYFDRYVYKQLRGWVSVGSERVKFQFNIPSFQRFLRLTLYIDRHEDNLQVKIIDTDYATKLAYYESYDQSVVQ